MRTTTNNQRVFIRKRKRGRSVSAVKHERCWYENLCTPQCLDLAAHFPDDASASRNHAQGSGARSPMCYSRLGFSPIGNAIL